MEQPTWPSPVHTPESVELDVARLDFVIEGEDPFPIRAMVMDGTVWLLMTDLAAAVSFGRPDREYPLNPGDIIQVNRAYLRSKTWRIPDYLGDWIEWVRDVGAAELCFKGGGLRELALGRWVLNTASPFLRSAGLREATFTSLPIKRHKVYGTRHDRRRPHVLYRLYDDTGQLLYVGISLSLAHRFVGHRNTKEWWGKVARAEFSHFPDGSSARAAERIAITKEDPLYNIAS